MRCAPRYHRRFTLLELLLVLALVGVLAGMVAPRLTGSMKRSRLETQQRSLIAMARKARALAAGEGRTYLLVVDSAQRELRLRRQRDPLAEADDDEYPEREADADERWSRPLAFEQDVEVSGIEVDGEEWTPEPGASDETLAIPFRANGTSTDVHVAFKLGEDEVAVSIDKNLGEARVLSAAQEAE